MRSWKAIWSVLCKRAPRTVFAWAVAVVLMTSATVFTQGGVVQAAASSSLLVSSSNNATIAAGGPGTVVHAATCDQAPPQSVKDRATYSAAELAKYGLPPRTPGEPFAKWAQIVRSAGKRVCDYTIGTGNFAESNSLNYAGNYADQATPGQVYSEADMDFFVACINDNQPIPAYPDWDKPNTVFSEWIGLGGILGAKHLVQAGVEGLRTFSSLTNTWGDRYRTWVEDNNGTTNVKPIFFFDTGCNQHIYVKAWDSGANGCMYLQRISDGMNTSTQCYNLHSDEATAEAIVELPYNDGPELADFSPATFNGVGITDNQSYLAMSAVPHDYFNLRACRPIGNAPPYCETGGTAVLLATTGPILNDPGDVPYDQYTITWKGFD